MQEDIKSTLVDVRRAYRLLFNYQQRILDLMSYIGEKFKYEYSGGYSKFSQTSPRTGGGRLENWAWDWLNMYYYEFHYGTKNDEKGNEITFSIFLLNDTGYFEAEEIPNLHKLNTESYKPAEDSNSKLIFVVGKNLWDGWGVNWDEPEFLNKSEGEKRKDTNSYMVFKHYLIEDFENEEKAFFSLKDFESYCEKKRIDFRLVKNDFINRVK